MASTFGELPHLTLGEKGERFYFLNFIFLMFIFFEKERETQSASGEGAENEGDTESEAGSKQSAQSRHGARTR